MSRARINRRTLIAGAGSALLLSGCSASSASGRTSQTGAQSGRTVAANVVYWDQPAGFAAVRRHADLFDQVSPMWYSLDRDGAVVAADDEYAKIDLDEVRAVQSRGSKVIPTLVDMRNGEWQPGLVSSMLSRRSDRDRHVRAVIELVDQQGYDGVDIDYEKLRADDREAFPAFLRELAQPLHDRGKLLTSGVYAKESEPGPNSHNVAQDYAAIGAASDQVRVQTFEYHYEDSKPGPIAPLDKVEKTIAFAVKAMPASKVILGVMLLGYDWPADGTGETVSYQQAMALARQHDVEVRHEGPGGSPTFRYTDSDGRDHEVWFEDAQSTKGKLDAARKYGVGGVFFWRLGGEDPATWALPELDLLRR